MIRHGNVTRDTCTSVTATRPDPTRPTVVTAVCLVSGYIPSHGSNARGLMDGCSAARFEGQR